MAPDTAAVHDLRRRAWGHNIEFMWRNDDGSWQAAIYLTARIIREGDYVLAEGKSGDLRYRVRGDVDRPMDPGDQHFVNLVYDPEPNI